MATVTLTGHVTAQASNLRRCPSGLLHDGRANGDVGGKVKPDSREAIVLPVGHYNTNTRAAAH